VGLLLLLKTFQRLGNFVCYAEIPAPIIAQITHCAGYPDVPEGLAAYDASTARDRHMALVRNFVGVTAYGSAALKVIVNASLKASRSQDDLPAAIALCFHRWVWLLFLLAASLPDQLKPATRKQSRFRSHRGLFHTCSVWILLG
jgi:hypothetical protein